MKRITGFAAALLLLLVLAGCNAANRGASPSPTVPIAPTPFVSPTPSIPPSPAVYKDGTYTGTGEPWANGSEDATVVVKNGKIINITLRRLDKTGKEVDYNKFSGKTIEGKTYPNLKKDRVDMANAMIQKQTYNVDTISGATTSTVNWKVAVQRALDKAKK